MPLSQTHSPSFSQQKHYFKAQEDGLNYGTRGTNIQTPTGGSETDLEVLNLPTRWDWGVRLGAGYQFCSKWDIRGYWTNFRTKGHRAEQSTDTTTLRTTWGTNFGPGGVTSAPENQFLDAHWRLRLNLADVELGNSFSLCNCFVLRPHVGIRAAWIEQSFSTFSAGVLDIDDELFPLFKRDRLKSDFEGIGVRTGMDLEYDLGCGLALYGKAAAAVVYGHFHNRTNEETTIVGFVDESPFTEDLLFNQKDHYHACRLMADASLGFRYSQ